MKSRVIPFAASTIGSYWYDVGKTLQRGLRAHGYELMLDSHVPDNRNAFTVGTGENEVGVTALRFIDWAARRHGPYAGQTFREFQLIAGLCNPSWVAAAIDARTGITSLTELAKRKHPWRVVLPQPDHAMAIYVDRLLGLHGITREKIVAWGGRVFYPLRVDARTEKPAEPWPMRTIARELAESGEVDGFVNYTRWSNTWSRDFTTLLDLRFLHPEIEAVRTVIAEHGGYEQILPARMYRGLDDDIVTIGWRYDFVYGTVDTPDDLVHAMLEVMADERFLENAFGHSLRRGPIEGLPPGLAFHRAVPSRSGTPI